MEQRIIDKVCNQIYRQFPEIKGTRPKVRSYSASKELLVFSGKVTTADGKSMQRIVRAVVNQTGKIEKITTSR